MPSSCAVATCTNTHKKTKERGVIYHVFPKNDDDMVQEWIVKCKRADKFKAETARICSDHFQALDYQDDMKNRLLGFPERKILKPTAVPSLNLPCGKSNSLLDTVRDQRRSKRCIRRDVLDRITELSPKKLRLEKDVSNKIEHSENERPMKCISCSELENVNKILSDRVAMLEKEICNLKMKNKRSLRILRNRKQGLKNNRAAVSLIGKKLSKANLKMKELLQMEMTLQKIFTPSQLEMMSTQKRKKKWTEEDISRGIVTRAISRKAYDFWRNKIGIPLPSASTLKRWCAKFPCYPGILHNVLLLMKKCSENLTEKEKLCVLSFDEIHVDNKICYDVGMDQVLGSYSKVQVVLARGIFSSWKQPIYFDFQCTMNKKLLFEIIVNLEKAGVKVKAVVSDLGGCMTLWKELSISPEKSFFTHPLNNSSRIWVFADPPHYLKILRNHFIDHGLVLQDGSVLEAEIIKEVLEKDSGEMKLCHKLLPCYITIKGNERQKVGPAKTLFSSTTAKAIELLTTHKSAAKFFALVDSFFDVMNSSHPQPDNSKPLKVGFGISPYFDDQKQVLQEMKTEISNLRIRGRNRMLPFQKGILVSISSIFGLYEDLNVIGVSYILTTRLTQDALESLFSQIRGIGVFYDHPSPSEFINRLKHILLANKLPNLSKKVNIESHTNKKLEVYLTAELIREAFSTDDTLEILEEYSCEINDDDKEAIDHICNEPWPEEWENEIQGKTTNELSWTDRQALTYVAGYIAYRVKGKYPSLGTISRNAENLNSAEWIKALSLGGLTVPTADWMKTVEQFETIFHSIHGTDISREKGIVRKLKTTLENQFPSVCKEAVHIYCRIRTFIRIRHLNRNRDLVSARRQNQKNKKWVKSSNLKI